MLLSPQSVKTALKGYGAVPNVSVDVAPPDDEEKHEEDTVMPGDPQDPQHTRRTPSPSSFLRTISNSPVLWVLFMVSTIAVFANRTRHSMVPSSGSSSSMVGMVGVEDQSLTTAREVWAKTYRFTMHLNLHGVDYEGTTNPIKCQWMHYGSVIYTTTHYGGMGDGSTGWFNLNTNTEVTGIQISVEGTDAILIDHAFLDGPNGRIAFWNAGPNNYGWCVSQDVNDAKDTQQWRIHTDGRCKSCILFEVFTDHLDCPGCLKCY